MQKFIAIAIAAIMGAALVGCSQPEGDPSKEPTATTGDNNAGEMKESGESKTDESATTAGSTSGGETTGGETTGSGAGSGETPSTEGATGDAPKTEGAAGATDSHTGTGPEGGADKGAKGQPTDTGN